MHGCHKPALLFIVPHSDSFNSSSPRHFSPCHPSKEASSSTSSHQQASPDIVRRGQCRAGDDWSSSERWAFEAIETSSKDRRRCKGQRQEVEGGKGAVPVDDEACSIQLPSTAFMISLLTKLHAFSLVSRHNVTLALGHNRIFLGIIEIYMYVAATQEE